MINLFLLRQEPPVCLVAHNGFGFDFGLLKAEIGSLGLDLPDGILCIDSLHMLQGLDAKIDIENEKKEMEGMQQQNQETPCAATTMQSRSFGFGLQIDEDKDIAKLMAVKRKLDFDPENKEAKTSKTDGYMNVAAKETLRKESTITTSVLASEDNSAGEKIESLSDKKLESVSSSCSTIICDLFAEKQLGITDSQDALECFEVYSTSEETTPVKPYPRLVSKLTCNETISEDSSDIEQPLRKISDSDYWRSNSVTDTMLMNINIDDFSQPTKLLPISSDTNTSLAPAQEKMIQSANNKSVEGNHCSRSGATKQCTVSFADLSSKTKYESPLLQTFPRTHMQTAIELPTSSSQDHVQHSHGLIVGSSNVRPYSPSGSKPGPSKKAFPVKFKLSYKLADVYKRYFNTEPVSSHRAEDDCVALMQICLKRGTEMLEWADEFNTQFDDVPPLYQIQIKQPLRQGVFPHQLDK